MLCVSFRPTYTCVFIDISLAALLGEFFPFRPSSDKGLSIDRPLPLLSMNAVDVLKWGREPNKHKCMTFNEDYTELCERECVRSSVVTAPTSTA